jgi:hypothetical protein
MTAMDAGQYAWVAADWKVRKANRRCMEWAWGMSSRRLASMPRLAARVNRWPKRSANHPLKGLAARAPAP